MSDSITEVTIHLTDIGQVSNENPLRVGINSNIVAEISESIDAHNVMVVQIRVPVPKISNSHKVYLSLEQKARKVDDIERVDLTEHGAFFMIRDNKSDSSNGAYAVTQRQDDHFSGQGAFGIDDRKVLFGHAEGAYVDTTTGVTQLNNTGKTLGPKLWDRKPLEKKQEEQAESVLSAAAATKEQTPLHIYLVNVPASKTNPCVINVNGQLAHHFAENLTLNKPEHVLIRIDRPVIARDHVIQLRCTIKELGIDLDQKFNLTEEGNYIQIAVVEEGEAVRVLHRKDNNFPAVPLQRKLGGSGSGGSTSGLVTQPQPITSTVTSTTVSDGLQAITFYLKGLEATMFKPCVLKINGQQIYKLSKNLGENEIAVCMGKIPSASINVTLELPRLGFDTVEETFDMDHGNHIMFEVVKKDALNRDLSIKQQHQAFETTSSPTPIGANAISSLTTQTQKMSIEPQGTSTSQSLADLEKLASLRDKGILTEEEFQAKKKQILGL